MKYVWVLGYDAPDNAFYIIGVYSSKELAEKDKNDPQLKIYEWYVFSEKEDLFNKGE